MSPFSCVSLTFFVFQKRQGSESEAQNKWREMSMSDATKTIEKAIVLWLCGVCLADIRTIPEVEALMQVGTAVELDPLPITSIRMQHYQVLSGRRPECFGFFDTLTLRGTNVLEELSGRDTPPKLLPGFLSAAGWTARYQETSLLELANCVHNWVQSVPDTASCLFVKCSVDQHIKESEVSYIAEALSIAHSSIGEAGLLALLSDTQHAPVKRFININNFLAEMGVIDRKEYDGSFDWLNSLAYHIGHGQLWINLRGRDPQGIVSPRDEYEEVRNTLVTALPVKLRDPQTGEPVIERVYRKEELYSGDYLFCAPDLVVLFKPGYAPSPLSTRLQFDEDTFITPLPGTTATAGVHPSSVTGFFLASAPVFAPGVSVPEHALLTSVAPTLLHALGVKYDGMDSEPLSALFLPPYLEFHPIHTSDRGRELSEEEEELVINRLRDLGYI